MRMGYQRSGGLPECLKILRNSRFAKGPWPETSSGACNRVETSLEIVVRSTEIDSNGHVNNAKYVEYLEWGREDWYERNGLPNDRLLALGAVTVTVNIDLNFRRECRQGEALVVTTRQERLGRSSFAFRQEIRNQEGALAADAVVTLVTIDAATRKSRMVPEELACALKT
jgi:YbgC/YbaW family acyl-CoA thioester hydrolase